ncbi:MAG: imidazole glycerol phosphate synthase subunit HisH [Methanocella sp.]
MIVIVDYGMGNLRSILTKLQRFDIDAKISADSSDITAADRLILPGVGHFAAAMDNLNRRGLIPVLNEKVVDEKTPILGICLGHQLFSKWSEEGNVAGLGWVDAKTIKFNFNGIDNDSGNGDGLKIPHMGWNTIKMMKQTPILDGIEDESRYYFVHSYHVRCNDPADVVAKTAYGMDFVSILQHDNIYGIQFHPEKSHNRGINILKNFAESG